MSAPAMQPYKLPLFSSKNMPEGTPVTPEVYVSHFIQGQKTACCFAILYILFPWLCHCQAVNAENAMAQMQYPILQSALNCVNTWNWVMFIFGAIAIVQNTLNIVYQLQHYPAQAVVTIIFATYGALTTWVWWSQIQSFKVARILLPRVGQMGAQPPMMQQPGMAKGPGYAPAPGGYQAPMGQPGYQAPPMGQPGYQAPPPGYQAPPPNNGQFAPQPTPFN